MKIENISTVLLVAFILASYAPVAIPALTETATSSQTFAPIPSASITPTLETAPKITATPLNLPLSQKDEIPFLIEKMYPNEKIYPHVCVGDNPAILTPPPQSTLTPPNLKITELSLSEQQLLDRIEIADNIDHSLRAYLACIYTNCNDLYVQNNKTGRVYKVDFGARTDFWLQGLFWVNKDTFLVAQHTSNMQYTLSVAINFNKQEYVYYGLATDCWSTQIPTP
jgi:hypothetical protein